jgi:hypothetical protein
VLLQLWVVLMGARLLGNMSACRCCCCSAVAPAAADQDRQHLLVRLETRSLKSNCAIDAAESQQAMLAAA